MTRNDMKRIIKKCAVCVYFALWLSVGATLVLCACSGRGNRQNGYVVGKEFDEAHVSGYYDPVTHRHRAQSYPARWFVWIADSTGVTKYQVSPGQYNAVKRGQYVIFEYGTAKETD